jgi:ComF family protein
MSLCPRCRRRPSALVRCRAIGPYEGSLRAIVQAMKYQGCRSLSRGLGVRLQASAADVLETADVVVPVPLHRARQRSRGFNQASDLARQLNAPVVAALTRVRATPSQTDLPAARRHANVRGAFALRRRHDVRGLRVVVVDDVSTTGATLEACARVLIDAGAASVSAVTAARAVIRGRE